MSVVAGTETQDRVVKAARACFRRYGVRRTRIDDVAKEAGMVRQTVYTVVASREELIERALIDWCSDLRDVLVERIATDRDAIGMLVEVLAVATEVTQQDEEFADLSQELSRRRVTELLAGPSPVHAIVADTFRPVLDAARSVLRDDVTDDELVEWFATILAITTSRAPRPPEVLRRFLRTFAVQAALRHT